MTDSSSKNDSGSASPDEGSLTAQQALDNILDSIVPLTESVTLAVQDSFGRILANDVISKVNVPPFRSSAMDGYAFRHKDVSDATSLTLSGESLAGHPFTGPVNTGCCIRVTTGALVPDDTDTVVMQENTNLDGKQLTITQIPVSGFNVRSEGSNIRMGQPLLKKGTKIKAAELGVLASSGTIEVDVLRKLKIAIFSTGDELVEPGSTPKTGQIHDSNRYVLHGLLQSPTIEILDLGIQPDDREVLSECMKAAMTADITLSSGGVSVGDADYVKEVLEANGKLSMWKILMKPGRPLTVGALRSGTVYFGLPGNPVSGMVTCFLFVMPAINKMLGRTTEPMVTLQATNTSQLFKEPGRLEYQRGSLKSNESRQWVVESTGLQDSHVLTSMSKANCFIILPLKSGDIDVGSSVEVIPFSNFDSYL